MRPEKGQEEALFEAAERGTSGSPPARSSPDCRQCPGFWRHYGRPERWNGPYRRDSQGSRLELFPEQARRRVRVVASDVLSVPDRIESAWEKHFPRPQSFQGSLEVPMPPSLAEAGQRQSGDGPRRRPGLAWRQEAYRSKMSRKSTEGETMKKGDGQGRKRRIERRSTRTDSPGCRLRRRSSPPQRRQFYGMDQNS